MSYPIKKDLARFKKIIKGKVKSNLSNYISNNKIPQKKGDKVFQISMSRIEPPRFRFGNKKDGLGQGDGNKGDIIDDKRDKKAHKEGKKAGNIEGDKELELEINLDDLANILGEELQLPNIIPKGSKNLLGKKDKYISISKRGPDALKNYKRSYREALKRQIICGEYNYTDPRIIPHKSDLRYRSWYPSYENQNSAVIIYMMDVSGSMGEDEKEVVRTESFWINLWLKKQYKDIDVRYIIHDATAKEVNEDTFFKTRESGGTLISSAFKLCSDIIKEHYDINNWNIYPFHFSDGDNWSSDDTGLCLKILDQELLPISNVFCYGQVESRYGSGQFYKDLSNKYGENNEKIILSKIKDKNAIIDSIKKFLSKGK